MWSLLHTAELAVAALALMSPPEESLRLRLVGDQLRATAQSLATDYPAQVAAAVAIDLGPIADRSHVPAACDMVVQLLSAVLGDCERHVSGLRLRVAGCLEAFHACTGLG